MSRTAPCIIDWYILLYIVLQYNSIINLIILTQIVQQVFQYINTFSIVSPYVELQYNIFLLISYRVHILYYFRFCFYISNSVFYFFINYSLLSNIFLGIYYASNGSTEYNDCDMHNNIYCIYVCKYLLVNNRCDCDIFDFNVFVNIYIFFLTINKLNLNKNRIHHIGETCSHSGIKRFKNQNTII